MRGSSMRTFSKAAAAIAGVLCAGAASAATVFVHAGAADPTTEGWTAYVGTSTTAGPVFNDLLSGYDAWSVDDNSTAVGSPGTLRYYTQTLSAAEVTAGGSAGWRLSLRLRVVDVPDEFVTVSGFGLASTIGATYRDATRDWYIAFGSEADGDPIVRLPGGGTFTLQGGGAGYHLYELVYDPVAGSADLFIDGTEQVSNVVGAVTSFAHNRVQWGAMTSPDDGHGNFNLVRFANFPEAVVPLPPAVLLLGSALFALRTLKRRLS